MAYNRPVDDSGFRNWWAEPNVAFEQADPQKAWLCGTAVTGTRFKTTGIAAYETYMTYGYLICAECEDGGAAIRRY